MTLDQLRIARPTLGFAVYAYTPGGGVTLEVHDAGEVYEFSASTEVEAIAKAFPESGVSQTPPAAGRRTVVAADPETVSIATRGGLAGGVAETPDSVFD